MPDDGATEGLSVYNTGVGVNPEYYRGLGERNTPGRRANIGL